jgi:hypothetical protein
MGRRYWAVQPWSTAVGSYGETEQQLPVQSDGLQFDVEATVQISVAVEPFQSEGQGDDQPVNQNAFWMMMANMLEAKTVREPAIRARGPKCA